MYNAFSCSTHLSMKFILLIKDFRNIMIVIALKISDVVFIPLLNVKIPTTYSKTCVKRPKRDFQDYLSLNAGQKYCRMIQ